MNPQIHHKFVSLMIELIIRTSILVQTPGGQVTRDTESSKRSSAYYRLKSTYSKA